MGGGRAAARAGVGRLFSYLLAEPSSEVGALAPGAYLEFAHSRMRASAIMRLCSPPRPDITKDRQEVDQLLDSLLATQGTSSEGSAAATAATAPPPAAPSGGAAAPAEGDAAAEAAPAPAAAEATVVAAAPAAAPKSREEVLSALAEDISRRLPQPFDIEAARYK